MKAPPQSPVNAAPVRRPAESVDDRLYRHVPMPPVYRDEDGYLLEDGMGRPDNHMIETSLW